MQITPIHSLPFYPAPDGPPPDAATPTGFLGALHDLLDSNPAREVSEEELFSAVVQDQLAAEPAALNAFRTRQALHLAEGGSLEAATGRALQDIVRSGSLDAAAADRIYSIAFQAAQLDGDPTALYDDRGRTRAVASASEAYRSASEILDLVQAGGAELQARSLDSLDAATSVSTASATSGGGGGGFLWKPVSESDGNLVVLLPPSYRGQVQGVELHRALPGGDGALIETGRFSGDTHNGGRPHFRFDQPGGAYGQGVQVVARTTDGRTHTWTIPHGAERAG